ncbi:glycosyltransferase family 2 protein [Pantoea eucalypti]|uniref:glycosyltransferase family 2 protein n=1 Tax=Pantoea eucalypti TaxID=470933 RepID=UPI0011207DD0|nr:glycosyltransferase family A protein [Pantoea eucalypti]MDJ0474515.1 glycosyltransferase family A protein [Pantoea eucalypti]TPD95776.1 glycosyltransferase [Pantoea vagans]
MSECKHPYYIFSPDYRESSGGIQALHKLCHQINLHGGQAWMVNCDIINPAWQTPKLNGEVYDQHKKAELIPVAVYPEIYSGNPMNAEVCVRYMLNHEALLNGNRLNETEEDLFFWYSSQLIVKEPDVDFLTMVGPDLEIFSDDGRVKTTKLLYLNRVPEEKVNFTRLPDDITIISVKNPRPLAELAEILKSATVMYTYEWSGTCNLAALCGVPVVSLVAPGYEKLAISDASIRDMGGAGVCFSDDPAELEDTRAGLYKVREHMRKFEANFSAQLRHFFSKTQTAAQQKSEEKFVSMEKWLAHYSVPEKSRAEVEAGLSLSVVVLDDQQSPQSLNATLTSLQPLCVDVKICATAGMSKGDLKPDHFSRRLSDLLAEDQTEWVMFLRAGDRIYPTLFDNLSLFSEKMATSLVCYTDRIWRDADGETLSLLLPDFDSDYFLATPDYFARGAFFRREVCLEIAKSRDISPQTVEMDFLFPLINADLIADIQHIPLPLLEVFSAANHSDVLTQALLAEHLALRGYSHVSIEKDKNAFSIHYNSAAIKKLTVIVVIEDEIDHVKRLLSTFVDTVTDKDYEIIFIDNQSDDESVRAWLSSLSAINEDIFRVFFVDKKISSVSALNYALSIARGEFTLYLSSGIYFNNKSWLEALLNHCGRVDLLACAPFLTDKRSHHYSPGVIEGAVRCYYDPSYLAPLTNGLTPPELIVPRQYLLLSSECIMLRTASCHQAGGLDEQFLTINEAIGDLLLRASDQETVVLAVPQSRVCCDDILYDTEHLSGDALFLEKWIDRLARDAVVNPNLSWKEGQLVRENNHSLIAARLGLKSDVLFLFNASDPAEVQHVKERALSVSHSGNGLHTVMCQHLSAAELYRIMPTCIVLSDVMAYKNLRLFRNRHLFHDTRFIVEATRASFSTNTPLYGRDEILRNTDLVVVRNTAALKLVSHKNVVLQADKLGTDWQHLNRARHVLPQNNDKPRVGIVLSDLQPEDWRYIEVLLKEMSEDVCWIVYGACPDAWKTAIHEYHRKVPQNRLPEIFQSLRLNLALAPLSDSLLNQAEGHRVIAQLGACGYPVLASDHDAYKEIMSVKRIKNKTSQWRFMIKKMISNPILLRSLGEDIYREVNAKWIYQPGELPAWLTRKDH